MLIMECLNDLIGITNYECECLHNELTEEQKAKLKVSKSGLYLDELEGGIKFRDVQNLSYCTTLLDVQKQAIETAKKHFKTDLMASINERYNVRKDKFVGTIGKASFTGSLNVDKRLQFIELRPENTDAVISLDAIRIYLNEDTSTKVWMYEIKEDELEGEIIFEENVDSTNRTIFIPMSAKLPLRKEGSNVRYFIIFERLGSVKPRNIESSCGCTHGDAYKEFISVSGGEADGFSGILNAKTDSYTHGFSLSMSVKCEVGNLICSEYDENDSISLVTAFALLYKSGELVIENILNSGEVNRFTMLKNEHLWGKRNHFRKEYNDRIRYLSQSIDVSSSNCFICKSEKFFLGNIIN